MAVNDPNNEIGNYEDLSGDERPSWFELNSGSLFSGINDTLSSFLQFGSSIYAANHSTYPGQPGYIYPPGYAPPQAPIQSNNLVYAGIAFFFLILIIAAIYLFTRK